MATSASLHKFGTGGGGLIGDGHRLLLRRCIFKEHSFESKDRDTGVVTKTYEPGCMLEVDMQVLDPIDPSDPKQSFVMQYYNVGNLPSKRVQQLGWQVDPKRPGGLGGYSPSTDNENPAGASSSGGGPNTENDGGPVDPSEAGGGDGGPVSNTSVCSTTTNRRSRSTSGC